MRGDDAPHAGDDSGKHPAIFAGFGARSGAEENSSELVSAGDPRRDADVRVDKA